MDWNRREYRSYLDFLQKLYERGQNPIPDHNLRARPISGGPRGMWNEEGPIGPSGIGEGDWFLSRYPFDHSWVGPFLAVELPEATPDLIHSWQTGKFIWVPLLHDWLERLEWSDVTGVWFQGFRNGYYATDKAAEGGEGEFAPGPTREEAAARLYMAVTQTKV